VLSFLLCFIIRIVDFKQNMGFKGSFNRNYLRMKNDKEIEADNYAKEHLISASEWEDFIKNFAPYTDETSMIVESQKSMIKTCASSISYLRKQTILMR
jgi:hypothetical protein